MQAAPPSIAEDVSRELLGEGILWAGTPDRWAYARKRLNKALFAIPWTAFAIFWTWGATQEAASKGDGVQWLFLLWGSLFIVFGLGMLFSTLWAAWVAGRMYYVVTEKRAVIFEKSLKLKIQSFSPAAASVYERVSAGGPAGDIIFEQIHKKGAKGRPYVIDIGFLALPDCSGAEQALKRLQS